MFKHLLFYLIYVSVALASSMGNSIDSSTYGNIEDISTYHLEFAWDVSFDAKTLTGWATHHMRIHQKNVDAAFFDIDGITIESVQYKQITNCTTCKFQDAAFAITTPNKVLGQAVNVTIPSSHAINDEIALRFKFKTSNSSGALSWLTAEQTYGKTMSYLFTQCEDTLCRTILPLQDTPAIKFTYESSITVPTGYKVKMSANDTSETNLTNGISEFNFTCNIPIQSYLIAIAVGNLEVRNFNDSRVSVITEPEFMDEVMGVFVDLPVIYDSVAVYVDQNPYVWGRYNLLVLPPSFPDGGMENPLLTFASPTIITADKSQVGVAAHEMAHSWTGNTVTCADWANFWLNEGFTVFIERKSLQNRTQSTDEVYEAAYIGNQSSYDAMQGYGMFNSYSSLHPNVRHDLPDNSFSEVPYEKGFQFLWYIQSVIGDAQMRDLINRYITENAYTSIKWDVLRDLYENFVDGAFKTKKEAQAKKDAVDWEAWIYYPGLSPVWQNFTTTEIIEAQNLAIGYINGNGSTSPAKFSDFTTFNSNLKVIFMQTLTLRMKEMNLEIIKKIDADLKVSQTDDPEVKNAWFPLGIRLGYDLAVSQAAIFVSIQGRQKYINPEYQALLDTNQRALAIQWLDKNKDFYHPSVTFQLQRMIYPSQYGQIITNDVVGGIRKMRK